MMRFMARSIIKVRGRVGVKLRVSVRFRLLFGITVIAKVRIISIRIRVRFSYMVGFVLCFSLF
jgi:hypothetical protein